MSEVAFRLAAAEDEPFLEAMLGLAVNWRDEKASRRPDPDVVRRYVRGFGRRGDCGVVAEQDGTPVGAAWYRMLPAADPGYGFVSDDIPELSVAVAAAHRGRGLATELLTRLLDHARGSGVPAISLSVEPANRAVRLYERLGFAKVADAGGSWTMLRPLDAPLSRSAKPLE